MTDLPMTDLWTDKTPPALILAGGLGTRLRPAVADRPKPLALVDGRPFIHRLLDHLVEQGFEEAVLLTGHLGDLVETELGPAYRSLRLSYSREETRLDTGGALRLALPLVFGDAFFALNGDSFCPADLARMWAAHRLRGAAATMLLTPVDDVSRYGRVEFDSEGRVTGFEEKGASGGSGWINAGVYVIDRRVLADRPQGLPFSLERDVWPELTGQGLWAFPVRDPFIDIGLVETYRRAPAFFRGLGRAPGDNHPKGESL